MLNSDIAQPISTSCCVSFCCECDTQSVWNVIVEKQEGCDGMWDKTTEANNESIGIVCTDSLKHRKSQVMIIFKIICYNLKLRSIGLTVRSIHHKL